MTFSVFCRACFLNRTSPPVGDRPIDFFLESGWFPVSDFGRYSCGTPLPEFVSGLSPIIHDAEPEFETASVCAFCRQSSPSDSFLIASSCNRSFVRRPLLSTPRRMLNKSSFPGHGPFPRGWSDFNFGSLSRSLFKNSQLTSVAQAWSSSRFSSSGVAFPLVTFSHRFGLQMNLSRWQIEDHLCASFLTHFSEALDEQYDDWDAPKLSGPSHLFS